MIHQARKKYDIDQLRKAWGAGVAQARKEIGKLPPPHSYIHQSFKANWARFCSNVNPADPVEAAYYINQIVQGTVDRLLDKYGIDVDHMSAQDEEIMRADFACLVRQLKVRKTARVEGQ